eukprot:COSAG04_NODE_2181_length_4607_cov_19.522099_5_plen_107_part_00
MYTSGGFQQNIEGNVFEGNGGPGVILFGTRATAMNSNCKSETILSRLSAWEGSSLANKGIAILDFEGNNVRLCLCLLLSNPLSSSDWRVAWGIRAARLRCMGTHSS